jgi:hypothetical protein
MLNSVAIRAFIHENRDLFWYTPEDEKENISLELLTETVLNYGSLNEVKRLIDIIGVKEISKIFFSLEGRKKQNYYPEIYNYFSLLFSKYAQRDPV